ncbi:hypothetical protein [Tolypothrix sp. VBCCA 56010]|uniref:hypothetical protein n=1 Tax=Tolypothrix sp. VBCCA 56010 TaxID=3137731 RepID=UPI003D7ED827
MYRLNNRAFEILRAEVQNCSGVDQVSKIEQQLVIKRLEKMRFCKGDPATLDELRDTVVDVYPQFSEKALKQAARANQPPGIFSKIKWSVMLLTSAAGVIWVVNLPFPMIRRPVAEKAPILLLPSFMSIDYHYRGAINAVEQADQLVNKATSLADIDRGAGKVKEAQKHLDNLPVWFLGYYPQTYCGLFACRWNFTLDEFEQARQQVARMDAKVFQEKNAFGSLNKGEQTLEGAKQQYQQAKNASEREKAIASWQAAIDSLEQLPNVTLSAETAEIKLKAYKRDFENARIGTFIAAAQEFDIEAEQTKQKQPQAASELWQQAINRLSEIPQENPRYLEAQKLLTSYRIKIASVVDPRSGTLIESAKQFAFAAAKASQNPPHSAIEWKQVENLWEKAIAQLESIRVEEPGYLEAQKLLATYQSNVGIVQTRFSAEQESQEILKAANRQIQNLIASPPSDRNVFKAEMQGIINQLRTIKPGTTAYAEAQQLLAAAYKKLK